MCEGLMFKNRGGDDAEGFCYGGNFQIGLDNSKYPAKKGQISLNVPLTGKI